MKVAGGQWNTYIDLKRDNDEEEPKLKIGDHVRISKYKKFFEKGYTPNWYEEVFVIKKVKNTMLWTYVISDTNSEEFVGSFYENELQTTNQREVRIEEVIKRKGDTQCIKWKGYDNLVNSWINKEGIVYMSEYFPKPYERSAGNVKVNFNLSSYTTKSKLEKSNRCWYIRLC